MSIQALSSLHINLQIKRHIDFSFLCSQIIKKKKQILQKGAQ